MTNESDSFPSQDDPWTCNSTNYGRYGAIYRCTLEVDHDDFHCDGKGHRWSV